MRNLYEQRRITIPIIAAILMAIIYAVLVTFLFAPVWNQKFTIGPLGMYDFFDEVQEIDEWEVDEGEFLTYYPAGSRIFYTKINVSELQKNDVFAYIETDASNKKVIRTQIFIDMVEYDDEATLYYSHDLDSMDVNSYTINSGNFLGRVNGSLGKIGSIVKLVSTPSWLLYIILIVLAVIMIGIPIGITVYRIHIRNLGSPFPEGVDKTKLSTENLYIYLNIKEFLQSAKMVIKNGYDCDLVYAAGILFAVLHCTNGNIYLNINKDFTRHDSRLDRSGYICIPHVANLDAAKRRINSMYRAYFADMVERRVQNARMKRMRENQMQKRRAQMQRRG
ncbi:MAG: hypothetical protein ACOX24_01485 [Christensenellales bacterium]|jgi:hypothetical protein|nr:hypothetical protein [Clostridiales bacterium]